MIKVANIIEDGRIAGPQIRIINVAKSLNADSIRTVVVIPHIDNSALIDKLEEARLSYAIKTMHRLTLDIKHLFKFMISFPFEVFNLQRFFRASEIDIVHVSGGSWQWKGVLAGRLSGRKVLWHLNDTSMPSFVKWIFKVLASSSCDGFILAGKSVEKFYVDALGVAKPLSFIIQAPVDCSVFDPDAKDLDLTLIPRSAQVVVTVANINRIKGLETFLNMAAKVSVECDNVEFYIVGPVYESQQDYYHKLLKLVEKLGLSNVKFYGPSKNVRSLLALADIYVCSSVAEASPTSVWEAMAMKKPVVSTEVGDVPYYIEHGKNGYLCDVGDSDSMARLVCKLINSVELRDRIGELAREVALENFDIRRCVELHDKAYRETMLSSS